MKAEEQITQNQQSARQYQEPSITNMNTIVIQPKERFGHKPSIIYRPEIDGLRTVAILPVILYHYKLLQDLTSGGFGGVDVFFVISGFLVNSVIISELLKQKFRLCVFYERRVRRLFPAIFFVLIIILISGYLLYFQKFYYQQLVAQETAALGSIANIYFYIKKNQTQDEYFDDNSQSWPFLHFWSLAVEEQFYLVTPLFLMILIKLTKKKRFLICMFCYSIITIIISLVLSIWLTQKDQMFAFYLLPCRAWQLGLGGLVAILLHNSTMNKIRWVLGKCRIFSVQRIVTVVLQIISWIGLIMILSSYKIYNKQDDLFPGYKALLPCCGTALFIASNFIRYKQDQQNEADKLVNQEESEKNMDSRLMPERIMLTSAHLLSLKPIVWVGQISYALYLWHWPIWVLFNYYVQGQMTLVSKCFCILLTFNMAYLSTEIIQNPIRNKKKVSTSTLWKGFRNIWILFISFLIFNIFMNIGGVNLVINEDQSTKNDTKNESTTLLYPLYDSQGYFIGNPNLSLNSSQLSYQKLGEPDFANTEYLINMSFSLKYDPNVKSVLINYSQEDRNQNQRICLVALGSSHTQQHLNTLIQLAQRYNISFGNLACSGTAIHFFGKNKHFWDKWRLTQLKSLQPRMIIGQEYWKYWGQNYLQAAQKSIQPLLKLPQPPQYIRILGDVPQTGFGDNKELRKIKMQLFLKKKYAQNGNSWQFLDNLQQGLSQKQIQIQNNIAQFVEKTYDNEIVRFQPYIHQLMQDRYTGKTQIIGSQVDGKMIYRDTDHLTPAGSKRFEKYFIQKFFKKAKQICK